MKVSRVFYGLAIVLLMVSLVSTNLIMVPVTSQNIGSGSPGVFEKFGPRVKNIIFNIAGTVETEFMWFDAGLIDNIDIWPPSPEKIALYKTAEWQQKVVLGDYVSFGYWEIDINELPPDKWKGKFWPTSMPEFRHALAHLVDKNKFVTEVLGGYGVVLDTFIAPQLKAWEKPDVTKHLYDRAEATKILTEAGFADYDLDTWLEYRNSTGTYEIDPPLQIWARAEDPYRTALLRQVKLELDWIRIPNQLFEEKGASCWDHAWKYYDYHLYAGGWGPWLVPAPDYLYDQWHSKYDIYPRANAYNYMRVHDPELDYWLDKLKFAPNREEGKWACYNATEIIATKVHGIPVWDDVSYLAHRKYYGNFAGEEDYAGKEWQGFVNMEGQSFINKWAMLNAHPADFSRGGTFRQGLVYDVTYLNRAFADMWCDWVVLDELYDYLTVLDPYNMSAPIIPWLCESPPEIGTWEPTPGKTATKITYHLIKNVLWQDAVHFTAEDVAFTFQYLKDSMSPLYAGVVEPVHHAEWNPSDPYTATVYFNVQSFLAQYWGGGVPMLPKHIWINVPPASAGAFNPEFPPAGFPLPSGWTHAVIGTGPFVFKSRVKGEYITLKENPIYFRKLVRPDFCGTYGEPPNEQILPTPDGIVEMDDFGMVIGHFGNAGLPWPHTTWDPNCDVNKDFVVDLDDIMEVGSRYGQGGYVGGYPPYYT